MRPRTLLPLLALLVLACAAPRHRVEARHCEVSAPAHFDRGTVESYAILADAASRQVAHTLALPVRDGIHIAIGPDHLADEDGRYALAHASDPPWILLGSACVTGIPLYLHYLGHELTHVYLDAYPQLPIVVEEGLAMQMSRTLVQDQIEEPDLLELEERQVEIRPELLNLTRDELHRLPGSDQLEVYYAGSTFVRRVGLERLIRMIREGEVSRVELRRLWETVAAEDGQ